MHSGPSSVGNIKLRYFESWKHETINAVGPLLISAYAIRVECLCLAVSVDHQHTHWSELFEAMDDGQFQQKKNWGKGGLREEICLCKLMLLGDLNRNDNVN